MLFGASLYFLSCLILPVSCYPLLDYGEMIYFIASFRYDSRIGHKMAVQRERRDAGRQVSVTVYHGLYCRYRCAFSPEKNIRRR